MKIEVRFFLTQVVFGVCLAALHGCDARQASLHQHVAQVTNANASLKPFICAMERTNIGQATKGCDAEIENVANHSTAYSDYFALLSKLSRSPSTSSWHLSQEEANALGNVPYEAAYKFLYRYMCKAQYLQHFTDADAQIITGIVGRIMAGDAPMGFKVSANGLALNAAYRSDNEEMLINQAEVALALCGKTDAADRDDYLCRVVCDTALEWTALCYFRLVHGRPVTSSYGLELVQEYRNALQPLRKGYGLMLDEAYVRQLILAGDYSGVDMAETIAKKHYPDKPEQAAALKNALYDFHVRVSALRKKTDQKK